MRTTRGQEEWKLGAAPFHSFFNFFLLKIKNTPPHLTLFSPRNRESYRTKIQSESLHVENVFFVLPNGLRVRGARRWMRCFALFSLSLVTGRCNNSSLDGICPFGRGLHTVCYSNPLSHRHPLCEIKFPPLGSFFWRLTTVFCLFFFAILPPSSSRVSRLVSIEKVVIYGTVVVSLRCRRE